MNRWINFWNDEAGAVVTSELVLLGTLGVVGLTVGMNAINKSVNAELNDVARAIRSLDQSYCVPGLGGCGAYTAGSSFKQVPVAESLELLRLESQQPAATTTTEDQSATGEETPATPAPEA